MTALFISTGRMPFVTPTRDNASPQGDDTRFPSAPRRGGGSRPQLVTVFKPKTEEV